MRTRNYISYILVVIAFLVALSIPFSIYATISTNTDVSVFLPIISSGSQQEIAFVVGDNLDYLASSIYIMNADGSNRFQLLNNPGARDWSPEWSPDGTMIAFSSDYNSPTHQIFIMDADGSNQRNITNNSGDNYNPTWSPDGTKIAFTHGFYYINSTFEIYVMNTDGSNQVNLTENDYYDTNATWSPDGTMIAFSTFRDNGIEIFTMNADGSNQQDIPGSEIGASELYPSWSPDGSKIAFDAREDGVRGIFVMNPDCTNRRRLTANETGTWDSLPAWSPDSTRIAFDRSGVDNFGNLISVNIYVMNNDGSSFFNISSVNSTDGSPSWKP